jgi:hypothetical protein
LVELADIVVLAEYAEEIAAGEEDGAGAAAAHQGRLLPEVGSKAGNAREAAGATVAALVKETVHAADAGAKVARLQVGEGEGRPVLQNFRGHEVIAGQEKTTQYFGGEYVMSLSANAS